MGLAERERSRRMQSRLRLISVGATSGPFLTQSANRVALTFFSLNGQRYTAFPGSAAVLDQGVNVPSASVGITLKEEDHADALRSEWTAIASAAAQTVAVLETILVNTPDVGRATEGAV